MTQKNDSDQRNRIMHAAADLLNARLRETSALPNRFARQERETLAQTAPVAYQRSISVSSLTAPPDQLYKYLRREHADALVQCGSTRIGTLRDFRNEEKYGRGIGDATEGTKTIHASINGSFNSGTAETAALNQLGGFHIGNGCVNTQFINCESVTNHSQPDALVWCCSTERSVDALTSVDGADACVEIFDVTGFFDALDRAIRAHFTNYDGLEKFGPAAVSYRSRVEDWNGRDLGLNPIFIKESSLVFSSQKEVRAAWFNSRRADATFEAQILPNSDCNQFCRIVDLL